LKRQGSLVPKTPQTSEFLTVVLENEKKEVNLPVLTGSDGVKFVDIQTLYAKTNLFCFDPGFTVTGSCVSAISNATKDGNLFYRGYSVLDLVQ
jgi:citrate synthase